jgi:hypothetical protein
MRVLAHFKSPLDLDVAIDGDVPSWITAGASIIVAVAALAALGQLKEVRRDRHVQVFMDLGDRWNSELLSAARSIQNRHTPAELAGLIETAWSEPVDDPGRNAKEQATKNLESLMRIPDFYEDLALITESGGLDIAAVGKNFKGVVVSDWDHWSQAMAKLRGPDRYAYSQWERLVKQLKELPDE